MSKVIVKSLLFGLVAAVLSYLARIFFHTEAYLADVGGLSAFLGVFGTLYGILAAFVVFEVWNQYNLVSGLIDKEAQGLERLYRLTLYFRDEGLTAKMKTAIENYANLVIKGKFEKLGAGERNMENGIAYRKIADIIRHIEFDDDHDSIVFGQIVDHYGTLGQIRTERQTQSLSRLPSLLKLFIYIASGLALLTFIVMPFTNPFYGLLAAAVIGFVQAMVFQIIEDLDNPFLGHWNLTPKSFERALKHIENDY